MTPERRRAMLDKVHDLITVAIAERDALNAYLSELEAQFSNIEGQADDEVSADPQVGETWRTVRGDEVVIAGRDGLFYRCRYPDGSFGLYRRSELVERVR